MNKIILLSITFTFQIFGAGEEGSGNSPITTTLDGVAYQFVCTPAIKQNETQNCIFVKVQNNDYDK